MARRGLGRGLDALMQPSGRDEEPSADASSASTPAEADRIDELPRDRLRPNPHQPRRRLDEDRLRELADSIADRGVVQPIIVRPADGDYEIVAGERRWRAAGLAGLDRVPVVVRECDDEEALELALIENLQREDLNPIEEAEGYRQLIDRFGLRQEDVGARVGRSRPTVANALRLLGLPEPVRGLLAEGSLSVGHAKALLSLPTPTEQSALAGRCVEEGWPVRAVERFVEKTRGGGAKRRARPPAERDPILVDVEDRLQQRLGTKVRIDARGERGRIEIEYYSGEELNRLLDILGLENG